MLNKITVVVALGLSIFGSPVLAHQTKQNISIETIIVERLKQNEQMKSFVADFYHKQKTIPKMLPFHVGVNSNGNSIALYGFRTDKLLPAIQSSFIENKKQPSYLDGKFLNEFVFEVNGKVVWTCTTNIEPKFFPKDKKCSYSHYG